MNRLLVVLLMLACAPAWGHALSVSHVDIVEAPDNALEIEIDLSLRDLALTLPLDRDRDERVTWAELQAIRAPLLAMIDGGVSITRGGAPCTMTPAGLGTRAYDEGTYAALRTAAECSCVTRCSSTAIRNTARSSH